MFILSLTGNNFLSKPLKSHPDVDGTLWYQADMQKSLMYLQYEAVCVSIMIWTNEVAPGTFESKKMQRGVAVRVEWVVRPGFHIPFETKCQQKFFDLLNLTE